MDFAFKPGSITVVIGVNNTIKWVNRGSTTHTVTSNDDVFDSGDLQPGDSFTCTFNAPGTYPYHCDFHSWMKETVIVVPP